LENLKERDHLEDSVTEGRIFLLEFKETGGYVMFLSEKVKLSLCLSSMLQRYIGNIAILFHIFET
jgi:hypothetical protein